MRIEDALIESRGCISHSDTCLLCETVIRWYTPVKKNCDKIDGYILATSEISRNGISVGREIFADLDIRVQCPECWFVNVIPYIKYKFK